MFAGNLLWRVIYMFGVNANTSLAAGAPVGRFVQDVRTWASGLLRGRFALSTGHAPLAGLASIILYLALLLQALTGVFVALHITLDLSLRPYFAAAAETHYLNYFVILILVVSHLVAVTTMEIIEGGTISAMVSGKKFVPVAGSEDRS